MTVHNHGIDPSCKERLVGECLLKPGAVVLDLDGHDFAVNIDDIREALNEYDVRLAPGTALSMFEAIADQIEAQTKPPRIPEPGWGAIVEAGLGPVRKEGYRTRLQRSTNWAGAPKWVREDGAAYNWDQLIDPVEIRKGVA